MTKEIYQFALVSIVGTLLCVVPTVTYAEIVWSGDFSEGNFKQYHYLDDPNEVRFFSVPVYGRPIQYGFQNAIHVGNDELLSLVAATPRIINGISYPSGPTRGNSEFSAKFTIKNSANGIEPADCDTQGDCNLRRSQLKMQATHQDWYQALPHMGERWVSWSFYLPADFWRDGSGFGPILAGIKQRRDSYANSGYFRMSIENDAWEIKHGWHGEKSPSSHPWQYTMFYSGNYDGQPYPRSDYWPLGLRDFPDEDASVAALQSVNVGGWTDWILHYKQDHRGSVDGGTGFMTLWKREDSGPWVKVLHILPKETDRGDGFTFDHGIGYNIEGSGAGTVIGMYMRKSRAWGAPENQFVFGANHKIGDENTTFSEMSPDGSAPGSVGNSQPAPLPPIVE